jgi:hypothetical protein
MSDNNNQEGSGGTPCPWNDLEFGQVPSHLDINTLAKRYRELSLRHHPDKAPPGLSEAERASKTARMQAINAAYELLQARLDDPEDPLNGVRALSCGGLMRRS